jgi:drug/metabolite transporter (DMT)-like permease
LIFLALAILGSALIPVLFRGFADWRVNVFWAIPVNYLTCVGIGRVWAGHTIATSGLPSQPWFWLAALQGMILAVNFFLLAHTAQRAGVSVAALASRLSVAIPSLLAFLIYDDSVGAAKIAGLAAALLSLYLCTTPEGPQTSRHSLMVSFLPVLVFLSFGGYFIVIKYAQAHYLNDSSYHAYVMSGFMFAFLSAVLICLVRRALRWTDFGVNDLIAGLLLGVVNYVAVYALVKALALDGWQSSQLYPVYSVGVVALSTLLAMALFNERLSRVRMAGLVVGLIAVVLLNR